MIEIRNKKEFKYALKYIKRFLKEHGLLNKYRTITIAYYQYNFQKYYDEVINGNKSLENFFGYTYFLGLKYQEYYMYEIKSKNLIEYMQEEYRKFLKEYPLQENIEKFRNEQQ